MSRRIDDRTDGGRGGEDGASPAAPVADAAPETPARVTWSATRAAYFALGFLMLALGFVGAFLPVMPTTIFLILAAWCFGRSSPRLEAWMLNHPRFGPSLRNWRAHGAIPQKAKWLACTGIASGYALFWLSVRPGAPLAAGVALFMLAAAAFIVTRPDA